MESRITQITTSKARFSCDNGNFVYETKANKVKVLLYALPKNKEISSGDFLAAALSYASKMKELGYQYLVSAEIENPNILKELAKSDGIRVFKGFEEIRPEDIYELEAKTASFDCSTENTSKYVESYCITFPLNGPARPPFTWFTYDPDTGKVLQTFYEKPENCEYCYATGLFEVGDEMFNDHYFDPDRKCIYYSCKRHDVLEQEEHNEPPSINNNEQR